MRMYTDPRGEAYEQVIDLAIRNSECFVLGEKIAADGGQGHYSSVLEALEPYLMKTIVIQSDHMDELKQIRNTYRSHAIYSAGTYYMYRCCEESGNLLKQMANRLADWRLCEYTHNTMMKVISSLKHGVKLNEIGRIIDSRLQKAAIMLLIICVVTVLGNPYMRLQQRFFLFITNTINVY
ncbi:hypothetical protein [Paenibacillus germinis]|uniref:hypothetical protein n=1 Tax=Paenibacillus germinis TaxID=2654979 RepID=UPI001FEAB70E|nr:hypothetical protein [Paenibacillus germinis]